MTIIFISRLRQILIININILHRFMIIVEEKTPTTTIIVLVAINWKWFNGFLRLNPIDTIFSRTSISMNINTCFSGVFRACTKFRIIGGSFNNNRGFHRIYNFTIISALFLSLRSNILSDFIISRIIVNIQNFWHNRLTCDIFHD